MKIMDINYDQLALCIINIEMGIGNCNVICNYSIYCAREILFSIGEGKIKICRVEVVFCTISIFDKNNFKLAYWREFWGQPSKAVWQNH